VIRLWDSFLSVLAAVVTVVIVGVPLWGAYHAVDLGRIPPWAWAPMVGLGIVGLIMVGAFLRKAGRGIHPLRERRR
jgi:hypothetical protein